ncbi:MAG TPA: O-acetyl-ADP-ribose deacetylase [Candidatus Baltobacteraceae bacterium]|jgi:O-acetyl-ADP-ribose deacetylase (regulator of RNase III)
MPIEVIVGDITRIPVDAVVNAANERLRGGGGVDGAIHVAAGPELLDACKAFESCPTGEVRVTPAFRLPARHVIHAVGPIWNGGEQGEDALLASAYRNALEAARTFRATSIAFPAISTGVYGFPRERAARIAIAQTQLWLTERTQPMRIVLVSFDDAGAEIYRKLLEI